MACGLLIAQLGNRQLYAHFLYALGRGGGDVAVGYDVIDLLHVSRAHTATTLKRMEDDGIVFDMFVGRMRRYYLCQRRGRE